VIRMIVRHTVAARQLLISGRKPLWFPAPSFAAIRKTKAFDRHRFPRLDDCSLLKNENEVIETT
jgi:hypothetical protein